MTSVVTARPAAAAGSSPSTVDPTGLDLPELVARVRDGRSSAAEVVEAHLAHLARLERFGRWPAGPGPARGAVLDPARIRAEAAGVDARPDRFALPLAGVPVVVADTVAVAGHPVRRPGRPTERATRDDETVRALRAAGAVVLGTVLDDPLATPLAHPRSDVVTTDHGGAAQGGTAAVAAGWAVLAVGRSDPLLAAATERGLLAAAPGRAAAMQPIAVAGRSAAALARGFGVLVGRTITLDGAGPTRVALAVHPTARSPRVPGDQRAAVVGAAARLRAAPATATVLLDEPPRPPRALRGPSGHHPHPGGVDRAGRSGIDRGRLDRGGGNDTDGGDDVERHALAAWRAAVLDWFTDRGVDVLLAPAPTPRTGWRGRRRPPGARLAERAGLPVVIAPVLLDGHPIGVRLVGRPGHEGVLLAAAASLEQRAVPVAAPARRRVYH